jgi:hypothetical protein
MLRAIQTARKYITTKLINRTNRLDQFAREIHTHALETFALLFGHELGIGIIELLLAVMRMESCQNYHFRARKAIDK